MISILKHIGCIYELLIISGHWEVDLILPSVLAGAVPNTWI